MSSPYISAARALAIAPVSLKQEVATIWKLKNVSLQHAYSLCYIHNTLESLILLYLTCAAPAVSSALTLIMPNLLSVISHWSRACKWKLSTEILRSFHIMKMQAGGTFRCKCIDMYTYKIYLSMYVSLIWYLKRVYVCVCILCFVWGEGGEGAAVLSAKN